MQRRNHYETAFEAFLRARRAPYVAVNESRRSLIGDESIKNLDFIVSPAGGASWLVDVKGRRFPSGRRRQFWKNWVTGDELKSMSRWEDLFGANFRSALVFAFHVVEDVAPLPADRLFTHRDAIYGFIGVRLDHFVSSARLISPRWDTWAMPHAQFRELARPVDELLLPGGNEWNPDRDAGKTADSRLSTLMASET